VELSERVHLPNHFFTFDFSTICISVLEHTSAPLSSIEAFVVPYTKSKSNNKPSSEEPEPATDLDDPLPSVQAELPCPLAIEFLADIYVEKTSQGIDADESLKLANELYGTLAKELDPMRQRYISESSDLSLLAPRERHLHDCRPVFFQNYSLTSVY
jgi:hypothetical protein